MKKSNMKLATAEIKTIRVAPRKVRLVVDLIRNQNIATAIDILKNKNKKATPIIAKLLNSAIANATNNDGMDIEKLYVYDIQVNEGPTMKRFRPRAHGRAFEILKRTSHIKIALAEKGGN